MNRFSPCLWTALLLAFIELQGARGAAQGQTLPSNMDDVTFTINTPGITPPIKAIRILLDGNPIPAKSPVPVSGNWVSKIAVDVENISSKDVIAGEISLLFLETGTGTHDSPIVSTISRLGRTPASEFRYKGGAAAPIPEVEQRRPQILIHPGGVMRFDFSKDITTLNDAYRIAGQIHTITIDLDTFYFADGSMWRGGAFFHPAPPPARWKIVPPDQF